MASPRNRHCADCIGALSFSMGCASPFSRVTLHKRLIRYFAVVLFFLFCFRCSCDYDLLT